MSNLLDRSIEVILGNQSPTGAYIASPNFSHYRYCWFRDGSFAAYAMDLAGEHGSAARFHHWAAGVINGRRDLVARAVEKARSGEPLGGDYLHARYDLDGKEGREEWANFQLDGLGTWLWALAEHQRMHRARFPASWAHAASLTADYLIALWHHPCYDCWEEFPGKVHPYTLAAIYGGVSAHETICRKHETALAELRDFLLSDAVNEGHIVKFVGSRDVDASLIGLAVPCGIVEPGNPLMAATIRRIESSLLRGGGVHRYAADSYYGGGAWLPLTAWLGWYYRETGQYEKAAEAKQWVGSQADAQGQLPEQVPTDLNYPDEYGPWRDKWGEIARPLLWSHANYIVLSLLLFSP
ncbi:MAG TPA: glycoside hydrolase family 15 protein [Dissulfurispiraceae bacterium]